MSEETVDVLIIGAGAAGAAFAWSMSTAIGAGAIRKRPSPMPSTAASTTVSTLIGWTIVAPNSLAIGVSTMVGQIALIATVGPWLIASHSATPTTACFETA